MSYCENCGCKSYDGACTNCHEELYIAEQHYELGTWEECSDEFKQKVLEREDDVRCKQTQTEAG